MGTNELRNRSIWQDECGRKAGTAENDFYSVFVDAFEGTDYVIRCKPKELKNIYVDVILAKEVLAAIFCPDRKYIHGLIPDYAIDNKRTGKTLYVEVKRQDGWVENKPSSAGAGEMHMKGRVSYLPQVCLRLCESSESWATMYCHFGWCIRAI